VRVDRDNLRASTRERAGREPDRRATVPAADLDNRARGVGCGREPVEQPAFQRPEPAVDSRHHAIEVGG